MNYIELRAAALKYWADDGGWMSTNDAYDAAFQDHDKVRFQLACSYLVLEGDHPLVRRKNPDGKGFELKIRTPDDPPYVEPPKVTRGGKKVVEMASPNAPIISTPATADRPAYVRSGNVEETPAEVRRHEPETMPVAHRTIDPQPLKNPAMQAALSKLFFKKDLKAEVPPSVVAVEVPYGASGAHGRSKGDVRLPQPKISAKAAPEVLATINGHDEKIEEFIANGPETLPEQITAEVKTQQAQGPNVAQAQLRDAMLGERYGDKLLEQVEAMAQVSQKIPVKHVIEVSEATGELYKLGLSFLKRMFIEALLSPEVLSHVKEIFKDTVASKNAAGSAPPEVAQSARPNAVAVVRDRHNPEPTADIRPALRKVAIIGIAKVYQEREVENEFGKKFDLKIVHVDANVHQVGATCKSADSVILLKDHISHKIAEHLTASNIKFVSLKGGVGKLKVALANM